MRIAFTCDDEKGMESMLAYHFGRCQYYCFVDVDEKGNVKKIEVEKNPNLEDHKPGASPNYMKQKNVDLIISGNFGQRASSVLDNLGIKRIITMPKKVSEVLDDYLQGLLE